MADSYLDDSRSDRHKILALHVYSWLPNVVCEVSSGDLPFCSAIAEEMKAVSVAIGHVPVFPSWLFHQLQVRQGGAWPGTPYLPICLSILIPKEHSKSITGREKVQWLMRDPYHETQWSDQTRSFINESLYS